MFDLFSKRLNNLKLEIILDSKNNNQISLNMKKISLAVVASLFAFSVNAAEAVKTAPVAAAPAAVKTEVKAEVKAAPKAAKAAVATEAAKAAPAAAVAAPAKK